MIPMAMWLLPTARRPSRPHAVEAAATGLVPCTLRSAIRHEHTARVVILSVVFADDCGRVRSSLGAAPLAESHRTTAHVDGCGSRGGHGHSVETVDVARWRCRLSVSVMHAHQWALAAPLVQHSTVCTANFYTATDTAADDVDDDDLIKFIHFPRGTAADAFMLIAYMWPVPSKLRPWPAGR